ncbi:MAG: SANT/Myb domain-containing protein [Holosporales bacterium]|nr:SANT/Myb domain-containing protein [Holosporales bacterium]
MLVISGPGVTEAGQSDNTCHRRFSTEEDARLVELVRRYQETTSVQVDWTIIARDMENRNPRQCRERFKCYLNPDLDHKTPWTDEEINAARQAMQRGAPLRGIQTMLQKRFGMFRLVGDIREHIIGPYQHRWMASRSTEPQAQVPTQFARAVPQSAQHNPPQDQDSTTTEFPLSHLSDPFNQDWDFLQ